MGDMASDGQVFEGDVSLEPVALNRLTLRFRDSKVEAAFQADHFRHNLGNLRFAFLSGAVLWALWGVVLYPYVLALADRRFDLVMRYGVFVPILLLAFGLSFTRWFERIWEWVALTVLVATILVWVYYISQVLTMPAEYGYVGLILITAFAYTLLRLRYVLVVLVMIVGAAAYLPYAVAAFHIAGVTTVLAALFVSTFGALGAVVAYRTERSSRLLFVREHQLDRERERSDSLLLNVLPQAIVARLKAKPTEGRMAEALEEVSVVFADAVGSTEQAARCTPDAFAATLDELFSRFDAVADRHGLEKVKTIGDAYMAVAGAPVPMPNHAEAAADSALDMLTEAADVRWPSGDPIVLRVGVASGPAVAGVIGRRKFAYDLWGDTVNLASRLEASGEPGRILVSEAMAELLADRYDFGPSLVLDLKGKGPTPVRFLLGRRAEVPAPSASC
jgi:class 3 adenylate cyclase